MNRWIIGLFLSLTVLCAACQQKSENAESTSVEVATQDTGSAKPANGSEPNSTSQASS